MSDNGAILLGMAFPPFDGIYFHTMAVYRHTYRHNYWFQPYHKEPYWTIDNKKPPIFKGVKYFIASYWIVNWCPKPESNRHGGKAEGF